jgi:hypothetical protein
LFAWSGSDVAVPHIHEATCCSNTINGKLNHRTIRRLLYLDGGCIGGARNNLLKLLAEPPHHAAGGTALRPAQCMDHTRGRIPRISDGRRDSRFSVGHT